MYISQFRIPIQERNSSLLSQIHPILQGKPTEDTKRKEPQGSLMLKGVIIFKTYVFYGLFKVNKQNCNVKNINRYPPIHSRMKTFLSNLPKVQLNPLTIAATSASNPLKLPIECFWKTFSQYFSTFSTKVSISERGEWIHPGSQQHHWNWNYIDMLTYLNQLIYILHPALHYLLNIKVIS